MKSVRYRVHIYGTNAEHFKAYAVYIVSLLQQQQSATTTFTGNDFTILLAMLIIIVTVLPVFLCCCYFVSIGFVGPYFHFCLPHMDGCYRWTQVTVL